MASDDVLFKRLNDLAATLPDDVAWLSEGLVRADGMRDLGERLTDLGAALITGAETYDRTAADRLPEHGWIPEAGPQERRRRRLVHHVGRGELRLGLLYLATCGAPSFPFYGKDPQNRTARHHRCPECREGHLEGL